MATQYDWQFINPLDQTANILAMNQGNQSVRAGLQGIADSVVGYANDIKQRNTDDILNQLYQAKTTAELPTAMNAVNALQRQYGRGYDQAAVRNAIDSRGATLGQRDLQNINLQQAQAAQEALPQLQAFNAARLQQAGATPEQLAAFNAVQGIDTTSQAAAAISGLQQDRQYNRGIVEADRNYNRQLANDQEGIRQWNIANERANTDAAFRYSDAFVTPAQNVWASDANGQPIPAYTPGVTRAQAFSSLLMNNIFNTESGNTHRDSKGNLTRSPAGALGVAQIMPATAAKPGYGMQPINLQTSSPDQQKAWATDYIGRIQKAHGFTIDQAVAAYNAGPGAVQNAIKKSPNNWLAQLPKETQNYVPKVLGGAAPTPTASGAIRGVPQANMSKVSTDYQNAITKLSTDYGVQQTKDQIKGAVAATGKNVDTWVTSKKESSWTGNSTNPMVTKAGDIGAMARQDSAFTSLPQDAQIKILEGAYGYLRNSGTFERVPNKSIRDFIHNEATGAKQGKIDQFNKQKEAVFQGAYQAMVQQYQQAGVAPPSIEGARKLLDPKAAVQTKQAPVTTNAAAQKAVAAVQPKAAAKTPSFITSGATLNAREVARQQGLERATNVANMPTKAEMAAMKAKALAEANSVAEAKAREEAFKKLEKERANNHKLSPKTKALLNEFGGGILK